MEHVEDFTTTEAIFIRHRNILLVRGDFTPIFTDYYLHLKDIGDRHPESLDTPLKDLLAVLTLHLTARPWAENIAWTANLRAPRVNFFATGSSIEESIVARLFTKDVREPDRNFLYSQTSQTGKMPRQSTIEVEGTDPLQWVTHYYDQSEQRPARAFRLDGDRYVLLAAQPDYDEEWLENLTREDALHILEKEEHKQLETRRFRFQCGCNLQKILPVLSAWKNKLDELFANDDTIIVQCPRCAKKYPLTRQDLL